MKDKYRILEGVCVAALVVFVACLFVMNTGGTDKDIEDIAQPVCAAAELGVMEVRTVSEAAGVFDFSPDIADGTVYYASENVMDVSELLIVKLCDKADAPALEAAIRKRVEDQKALYKNYAPQQYSLLQNCIIEVSGNTVFYCTAENAPAFYDAFKQAL